MSDSAAAEIRNDPLPGVGSDPSSELERELWRRWRQDKDGQAREALILRYTGMARALARRIAAQRGPLPDLDPHELQQAALVGLIESVDRFDPEQGVRFPAFSRKRVHGAVTDAIARGSELRAQLDWQRTLRRERMQSLEAPGEADSGRLERLANVAVGLAIGFMLEDTAMFSGGSPEQGGTLYDCNEIEVVRAQLRYALEGLADQQRLVMELHYYDELSFSEIGEALKLSKTRVSQVHSRAMREIRQRFRVIGSYNQSV